MELPRNAPIASTRLALVAAADEPHAHDLAGLFGDCGVATAVCTTAATLLDRAKTRQPLLIAADPLLLEAVQDGNGTVLEALRNGPYTSHIPVVAVLPPDSGEAEQVEWFARGAAECLVQPLSRALLQWRVHALAQRLAPDPGIRDTLGVDGLTLDLLARKTTVDGAPVALTRKEFDLLNMLLRKRGTVAYTTHLYHSVWGYGDSSPVDSHTVKVHISSLRNKLGPKLGRRIVNLPGLGYRFDD